MKLLVQNYTFDASEKKITLTDYNPIVIERVLLITNITDNIIIYHFADPLKGGTAAANVLTLTYDTAAMDDTDKLQIFYDDVSTAQLVSGTVTANLSAIDNAVLDQMELNQDAQTALQTTLNALIETLQELTQRLAPLAGIVNNTAQLRTVTTGAVTATGGGYITSAQSIAEKAVAGVMYTTRVAQENMAAVQSNINNVEYV